jgi:hypothetical protein
LTKNMWLFLPSQRPIGHCAIENGSLASRVAQWSKAVPPEILGSSPGSVAAGCDREDHGAAHDCASVVREGLVGRDILVSLRTSDSCGGPGTVHADQVTRCTVFPPAGFRVGCALCQEAGWVVFRRTHGSRPKVTQSDSW